MTRSGARHARSRVPYTAIVVVVVIIAMGVVAWRVLTQPDDTAARPVIRQTAGGLETLSPSVEPNAEPKPERLALPAPDEPINLEHPGFTTLRGNWYRAFQGMGPVPRHPKILWREGPWCGQSTEGVETRTWCGTGWNGTPNVIPLRDGETEVRVGGYDHAYHFLDADTGKPTHPEFRTGDLAKGSATSDPDGCPLYYVGSRDNQFRILATDRHKPVVLWSMTAKEPYQGGRWNNDWDGAAQIVGDYMLLGGEDSWFRIVRLNKDCDHGKVKVDPKVVFEVEGWDGQLIADLGSTGQSADDISIENAPAYDPSRQVVYFGNGGGLVQGWDISGILKGGTSAKRVFRYWMAGENDASIVLDEEGDLYASSHYVPPNGRAQEVGQLIKLDPSKSNPLVWKVKETTVAGEGEAGFFSTPALVGDTIFASANGGDVMAIDRDSGKVYWRMRLPSPLWSGPVVVDGTMVIGDCSGTLSAFDVAKPKKKPRRLWAMRLGGCIESTPAVWSGRIYVGTRGGYLFAIGDKHPDKLQAKWDREHAPPPPSPSPSVPASVTSSPSPSAPPG